jgi:hypothetical protein
MKERKKERSGKEKKTSLFLGGWWGPHPCAHRHTHPAPSCFSPRYHSPARRGASRQLATRPAPAPTPRGITPQDLRGEDSAYQALNGRSSPRQPVTGEYIDRPAHLPVKTGMARVTASWSHSTRKNPTIRYQIPMCICSTFVQKRAPLPLMHSTCRKLPTTKNPVAPANPDTPPTTRQPFPIVTASQKANRKYNPQNDKPITATKKAICSRRKTKKLHG